MTNPLIAQPQLAPGALGDMETDPKKVAAQSSMMKLLAAQAEPIIALFDRLGIPWERKTIKEESYLIIKWSDLMEGERKQSNSPTFLQRIAQKTEEEMRGLQ